jgi:hypothetical protein
MVSEQGEDGLGEHAEEEVDGPQQKRAAAQ